MTSLTVFFKYYSLNLSLDETLENDRHKKYTHFIINIVAMNWKIILLFTITFTQLIFSEEIFNLGHYR
jgi:hypothetical protein